MNKILLFGAGKSATVLIEYLAKKCESEMWQLAVFDSDLSLLRSKTRDHKNTRGVQGDVSDDSSRESAIENADLVISMLPPQLHIRVAHDCLKYSKHLITASYIDDAMRSLAGEINNKNLLFLCEMGLDPGIDHMSAMKMFREIYADGGYITSFKSHCGGLIAPESDNNPWHYKITWNPMNVVMAGAAGATFRKNGVNHSVRYQDVFSNCEEVQVPSLPLLAAYPNRDSLSYMQTYGLDHAETFVRTTLRYPSFCNGWNRIINYGLTSLTDESELKRANTYLDWFKAKSGITNLGHLEKDRDFYEQISYLGLLQEEELDATFTNSAQVMRHLLESRLALAAHDIDMIVMQHEVEYNVDKITRRRVSSLVVKGDDNLRTAMAKTVGLPLGIAAVLILSGKIEQRGLEIPLSAEIYNPVLKELEKENIRFAETFA